jgi:hypothetical protein
LHWVGLLIWLGGAIAGTGLILLGKLHRFWAINLVTYGAFILFFITSAFGVVDSVRQLPLRQIAATVVSVREINEPIAMATNSFEKPSLVFYTQKPIVFINRAHQISPYLEQLKLQKVHRSMLMITTPSTLQEAKISSQTYQAIKQIGIYQLIRFPLSDTK